MTRRQRTSSVLAILVGVSLAVAGCGGSETAKRLPEGNPCELATPHDIAKTLSARDATVETNGATQCIYLSTDSPPGGVVNVMRGQAMSNMATDETIDLQGVEGTRLDTGSKDGSDCGVGVVLDPDDPQQQFGVVMAMVGQGTDKTSCQVADEVATRILDRLPE